MAGKSNSFETSLLQHIFQNADIANIGDAAGLQNSATDGSLYVSLHTADPGEAGSQTTNEVAYTSYARVGVSRTGSTGWTVSSNQVSNTAAIVFPTCGVTGATALYWGIGTASSGAGVLLYSGALSSLPVGLAQGESTDNSVAIKNHALAADDRIALFALGGLALPTGVTEGTVYYVGSIVSIDAITLSTTPGNANPVSITVDGQGIAYKVLPFSITTGITPTFAIGALQVIED